MNIVIADVSFGIDCQDIPLLFTTSGKPYGPFTSDSTACNGESVKLDVSIEIDKPPAVGQFAKMFHAPDSWSLFARGDEYLWTGAASPEGGGPAFAARFNRRSNEVVIYCGDAFVAGIGGKRRLVNPLGYPLDQVLLVYALAEREGALIHACAVELNGGGYVFAGRSGAGKSTISEIFTSGGHSVLSDDRVVVRKIGDAFRVFGTPWAGDAGIAENRALPLQGIFFIVHGEEDRVEKLSPREAFERLMPVTSVLWYDEKVLPSMLSFCEDIAMNVPAYDLYFRPGEEVVDMLQRMTRLQ